MSIFGWSYPPGCSSRDVDEAMGGNAELEALEEAIFERPELSEVTEEKRLSLCVWIIKLVSDAKADGRTEILGEQAYADALAAEHKLEEEWRNNPGEQVF